MRMTSHLGFTPLSPNQPGMTKYSLLDLVSITEGGTAAQAFKHAADTAVLAEKLGFARYWVAEHHGMTGIGGAATSLVISHLAAATKTIRVGAGGIMLPNHAPLVIAEQFGTLHALYGDRIDLGLGRAPGGDGRIMQALRRPHRDEEQAFVQDILFLQSLFADDGQTGIVATPGAGAKIGFYILGSSLYGAQVAAALGLPYAFASHFAPKMLDQALEVYRDQFRPSAALDKPYVMAAFNVIAAESDTEAEYLASSLQQSFINLRTGRAGKFPAPVKDYRNSLPPDQSRIVGSIMRHAAIGGPAKVKEDLHKFIERTGADEIVMAGSVFDPAARLRSLEIAAAAMN